MSKSALIFKSCFVVNARQSGIWKKRIENIGSFFLSSAMLPIWTFGCRGRESVVRYLFDNIGKELQSLKLLESEKVRKLERDFGKEKKLSSDRSY